MAGMLKTEKIVKYLITLFAMATILILAGGAKNAILVSSRSLESVKAKTAALLYVPNADNKAALLTLAERSPEFLLLSASGTTLKKLSSVPAE